MNDTRLPPRPSAATWGRRYHQGTRSKEQNRPWTWLIETNIQVSNSVQRIMPGVPRSAREGRVRTRVTRIKSTGRLRFPPSHLAFRAKSHVAIQSNTECMQTGPSALINNGCLLEIQPEPCRGNPPQGARGGRCVGDISHATAAIHTPLHLLVRRPRIIRSGAG
jgi:hypothetical protein